MTGYPAKEDEIFADSLETQMQEWIGEEAYLHQEVAGKKQEWKKETEVEMALELDRPALYTAFLEQDSETFFEHLCKENGVLANCFRRRKPDRLYLGNAFCHLLFRKKTNCFPCWKKPERRS